MFFAVTGAMGHIPTVVRMAPSLFLHTLIQITVHFAFTLGVGKLFKFPFREIVLASNANVGGKHEKKLYTVIIILHILRFCFRNFYFSILLFIRLLF